MSDYQKALADFRAALDKASRSEPRDVYPRDELEAAGERLLASIDVQKPAGEVHQVVPLAGDRYKIVIPLDDLPIGAKLYAAPPAPAVPDFVTHALAFYADPLRYNGANQPALDGDTYTPAGFPYRWDMTRDSGDLARAALAKIAAQAKENNRE